MALRDLKSILSEYNTPEKTSVTDQKINTESKQVSPIFKHSAFHENGKYESVVGKSGALGERYTRRNSPSFLDDLYTKYNLRDESFNPTYTKHPLILRGIQRPNNPEPQRWGGVKNFGYDDGLIRGGTLAFGERAAVDTERITKFLSSPKGLVWIGKQNLLALTNPKVETNIGIRLTRVHPGINSLLSVPTTGLGLHFTTHGIPFANEVASYENVMRQKSILGTSSNRLVRLRGEYGLVSKGSFASLGNSISTAIGFLGIPESVGNAVGTSVATALEKGIPVGTPSSILSGINGPQSVYGLGSTQIRRTLSTKAEGSVYYTIRSQYASKLNTAKTSTKDIDGSKKSVFGEDGNQTENVETTGNFGSFKSAEETNDKYPFNTKNKNGDIVGGNAPEKFEGRYTNSGKILGSYEALAYGKLSKDHNYNDFRKSLTDGSKNFAANLSKTSEKSKHPVDYKSSNIQQRFGFGQQGKENVDRSDYLNSDNRIKEDDIRPDKTTIPYQSSRGDLVNLIDTKTTKYDDIYRITPDGMKTEDLVKFFFSGPRQMIAGAESDVIVFRSTITGFTDNFKPTWDSYKMVGRADPVYIYKQYEREVNFQFSVAATSREEMKPIWRKLNALASYTAPYYPQTGKGMVGPFMRLTMGDYFQETPGFLTALTYTINEESTWEINLEKDPDMYQMPKVVDVDVTFTVISDFRPQLYGRFFSLSPRGSEKSKYNQNYNWMDYSSMSSKTDSTTKTKTTPNSLPTETQK